jgi:hypothetical protein
MDKAYLEKLDASEISRFDEIWNSEPEHLDVFFKYKTVSEALKKGNQASIDGFDTKILPNTIPFSDKTFVQICTGCSCVNSPELIMPYLERELVIPILNGWYENYPTKFIESILRYPHVSKVEYLGVRNLILSKTAKLLSQKRVDSIRDDCLKIVNTLSVSKDRQNFYGSEVVTFFSNIQPAQTCDREITYALLDSLKKNNFEEFNNISMLSHEIEAVRNIKAFSFMPQVELSTLQSLKIQKPLNNQLDILPYDVRDSIMNGLEIAYNPQIPLETYIDIVSERKTKISGIVNKIVDKANPDKTSFLSNLQTELEYINEQVRTLESSTGKLTVNFITNFALQNKGSIVACILIGASASMLGLDIASSTAGAASAAALTKAVSHKVKLSVPKEATVLKTKLCNKIEPYYEQLLAKSLSIDIDAVQVWRIKSKLKNAKSIE